MPDNLIINLPILAKACSVYSRFGSAMTGMTTHAPNVGNIGVYSAVQFGASWTLWRCYVSKITRKSHSKKPDFYL